MFYQSVVKTPDRWYTRIFNKGYLITIAKEGDGIAESMLNVFSAFENHGNGNNRCQDFVCCVEIRDMMNHMLHINCETGATTLIPDASCDPGDCVGGSSGTDGDGGSGGGDDGYPGGPSTDRDFDGSGSGGGGSTADDALLQLDRTSIEAMLEYEMDGACSQFINEYDLEFSVSELQSIIGTDCYEVFTSPDGLHIAVEMDENCACDKSTMHTLSSLSLPQQSEYTKLIQYIGAVKDMCYNRCNDYELHGDFLENWLIAINSAQNVTTSEVYEMALWCKSIRDEILARHLLQFGNDLITILDIATWEYDLFVTQRFFSSVPSSSRTWGINRMISKMTAPISSFSSLRYAQKFGIQSYDDLVRVFNELGWSRSAKGVEFHHLIEQRFVINGDVVQWMGNLSTGKWPSIVVDKIIEHGPLFTQRWRQQIGYGDEIGELGVNTTTATIEDIKQAARIIYSDFPEILAYLGL